MTASEAFRQAVSGLIGKAPWEVRLGWGSFLTLEFGASRLEAANQGVRGPDGS